MQDLISMSKLSNLTTSNHKILVLLTIKKEKKVFRFSKSMPLITLKEEFLMICYRYLFFLNDVQSCNFYRVILILNIYMDSREIVFMPSKHFKV